MSWDPAQYERFHAQRSRPFEDLLALVRRRPDMQVIDLGCGTGQLTRRLHAQLGARATLGIDSSASMLAQAASPDGGADVRFVCEDIADVSGGPYDLVFSNAALHWLDDHAALLTRLTALIAPGGQLAVQVPAAHDEAPYRISREVAAEPPFCDALQGHVRHSPVLAPVAYARLLDRLGYVEQQVQLVIYPHHLESLDAVVEWLKGAVLVDYARRMPEALFAAYLRRYRERLGEALADERPVFFPFPRILFWAQRP